MLEPQNSAYRPNCFEFFFSQPGHDSYFTALLKNLMSGSIDKIRSGLELAAAKGTTDRWAGGLAGYRRQQSRAPGTLFP
ncbi:MAG: hypothetical protein ACREDR_45610, partial [Blastocatellia bacterium]